MMRLLVDFRDAPNGPWIRSRKTDWSFEDINVINKSVGYEKYRVVHVSAIPEAT